MAASTDDKFRKVGAGTVTTLSSPGKALGATSINVGATTNFPTATGIIIAIRTVDTNGELVAGTYTEYSATVSSGTALAIVATPVYGNDQVYAAGSTTQVYVPASAYAQNAMVDGILVEHNQDGTHKTLVSQTLTTPLIDTIVEKTSGHGVTVDGLNIKDGKLNTIDSVVTANITDANVTAAKIGSGAFLVKEVTLGAGGFNTTSETLVDITESGAGTGDVTLTLACPSAGIIHAFLSVDCYNNSAGNYVAIDINIDGSDMLNTANWQNAAADQRNTISTTAIKAVSSGNRIVKGRVRMAGSGTVFVLGSATHLTAVFYPNAT